MTSSGNQNGFSKKQRHWLSIVLLLALLLSLMVISSAAAGQGSSPRANQSADGIWYDVENANLRTQGERLIIPDKFRSVGLDVSESKALLVQAPLEGSPAAQSDQVVLSLPLPDGGYGRFRIVESPIMEPELAAEFPEIKTYAGQGVDDPVATVRFDWTPQGFHAMILSSNGNVFIDPYARNDTTHYISYFKQDITSDRTFVKFPPLDPNGLQARETADLIAAGVVASAGSQLRTYRLAVAATGEYTAFHGGTVPLGQAAIVTAINRVTGIYEVEVAVRLVLVANNSSLVYTNAATDPYNNGNASALLDENQINVDAVIGNANYDVGHVFSTGGGGLASLGVICNNSAKARGETGLSNPINDPFYVDFVSHELGHQFAGNHTFNGSSGNCSGGNRNASTAYEPGSGSTIQAYAGICAPQNLQSNSDAYFHTLSFDEIVAHTTAGSGSPCATVTNTGNNPPVANANANGANGVTIPINTPFTLTGSATDPDGDPLTYNWEEYDLGPAGHPDSPVDDAPIFRSFTAQTSPSRTFPQISDIVNNTHTLGELLPSYPRNLTFRMTTRDNRAGGGGVDHDQIAFSVTDQAGPFLVTAPNTAVTWTIGSTESVTWDVANTDSAPVNCTTANIMLSTDGGFTYPVTLASNVINDGSQAITVPNNPTTTARVKVACADNIFFDISNSDFTIQAGVGSCTTYNSTDVPKLISETGTPTVTSVLNVPDSFTIADINVLNLNGTHTWINDLDFNLSSPAATEVQIMSPSCADSDNFDLSLDDEATPGAWPCPPVGGGTYQPSNPLSAFDGQNSSGNWTLTINDNEDPDGGSLEGWSLEICGEPVFADFGGTPTSGIAPLTVNFTNLSSGGFDTCVWDFGDGGDSTSCGNPSHEFTAAGTYTVSLAVSGPGGNDTETKTDYITVDHNPFVYLPMIIRTD